MSASESSRARGVDRVIGILKQLHIARRPMTMRELIEATDAPRSSIYELVTMLTEAGWLETSVDGSVFSAARCITTAPTMPSITT